MTANPFCSSFIKNKRSNFVGRPSFIRPRAGSEGEAQYLSFSSTYLVDHVAPPRRIDAANQDCAEHVTVDAFKFGRHWECLCAVDVFVSPPNSQGCTHAALGALKFLPFPMKTVAQYIKGFAKGVGPRLCLCFPHSRSSRPRVCVCLSTTKIQAWAPHPDPAAPP